MKVHINDDQLDGKLTPRCHVGRPGSTVYEAVFEATEPRLRCKHCERWWFPNGQPDWHLKQAQARLAQPGQPG